MKKNQSAIFVLKPDGIGDFVLASGALRLLARECGEENLVLAVLPAVAPLARQQFPSAEVIALPLRKKRVVLNLFLANFLRLLPVWARLLRREFVAAISLRHSRSYLHSFLLASLHAKRLCLVENQLGRGGSKPRTGVETFLWRWRRAVVVPYPFTPSEAPLEIEANRRVLSCFLGREVALADTLPTLHAQPAEALPTEPAPVFLCPFSTDRFKDFPDLRWLELVRDLLAGDLLPPDCPWVLTGSPEQSERLGSLAAAMREAGLSRVTCQTTTTLPDFVLALARARLVLTVDTAAAHIATALNRPTLVAFAGLHRGVYAPWQRGPGQIWLEAESPAPGEAPRRKSQWHTGISRESLFNATRILLSLSPTTP